MISFFVVHSEPTQENMECYGSLARAAISQTTRMQSVYIGL